MSDVPNTSSTNPSPSATPPPRPAQSAPSASSAASSGTGILGCFGVLWTILNTTRIAFLNLLFFGLLFFLVIFFLAAAAGEEGVPERAALVLDISGALVDEMAGDPLDRALADALDEPVMETSLPDLVEALRVAKTDDRIQAVYLSLSGMSGGGFTKIEELQDAIDDFRTSGKPVIASASNYTQGAYYLATAADEIYLNPMGALLFEGLGVFPTYMRDGLDRLGVDVNVFRVGEFKSAVEPYLRDSMSEEAKTANVEWLGDLWDSYLEKVAQRRGLDAEQLRAYVETQSDHLRDADGDLGLMVAEAGLVSLAHPQEVREHMISVVGDNGEGSFQQIGFREYRMLQGLNMDFDLGSGDKVAVVVASGVILDGEQDPGTVGGSSTARRIRQARTDDSVKAIVLRVDSPGGSAFASEMIRQELVEAREQGLPVVVSMGSVAASGGYWISTASDEIWAGENTITGSIGIFGLFPTFQKPLKEYLGMTVDGVGTSAYSGILRLDRPLDPRAGDLIQTVINRGYDDFLTRVADARGMTREQVDEVARGRVWSGADAYELGLVDQLGDLDDAIASAATRAGLTDGKYTSEIIEPELDFFDQMLLDSLESTRVTRLLGLRAGSARGDLLGRLLRVAEERVGPLSHWSDGWNDPANLYAHCLCTVDGI
ncbi:MAG: signal peptide peptidase SppA [Acidobacteriota bacterium]